MGTHLEQYRAKLAKMAETAASEEVTGSNFFTTQGGVLKYADEELPGNEMVVVIVDSIHENTYYTGTFDPDNILPPKCFAFGRTAKEMEPHTNVPGPDDKGADDSYFEMQAEWCDECPHNEWGSAEVGRGKACSSRRRLAVIPAGRFTQTGKRKSETELQIFTDVSHFKDADIAFLKIPVTSTKAYSKYVQMLNKDHQCPPFGVLTHIFLEPHKDHNFEIGFEMVEVIEDTDILEALFARNQEAGEVIEQPYNEPTDEELEKPKASEKRGIKGLRKKK